MGALSKTLVIIAFFTSHLIPITGWAEDAATAEVSSGDAAAESSVQSTADSTAAGAVDLSAQSAGPLAALISTPEFTTALAVTTVVVVGVAYTTHKWDEMQMRQNYARASAEAKVHLANAEPAPKDGIYAQVLTIEKELLRMQSPDAKPLTDQQLALLVVLRNEALGAQAKAK